MSAGRPSSPGSWRTLRLAVIRCGRVSPESDWGCGATCELSLHEAHRSWLAAVNQEFSVSTTLCLASREICTTDEMRSTYARLGDTSIAIIDCSDADHLDFSFLLQLARLRDHMRTRKGEVRLVVSTKDARRTLAATGFDRAFAVYENITEAERGRR